MAKVNDINGAQIIWNDGILNYDIGLSSSTSLSTLNISFICGGVNYTQVKVNYDNTGEEGFLNAYNEDGEWIVFCDVYQNWKNENYKNWVILSGEDTSDEKFINFILQNGYIQNGTYGDGQISDIEVKYGGDVIANISVGKTVELKCENKKMLSDIVVSYKIEEEEEETPSIPTDLTGYTVSVPSGWSATAGYGNYNVDFVFDDEDYENLRIGYIYDGDDIYFEWTNAMSIKEKDLNGYYAFDYNDKSFSFLFVGGTDVTNQSLIQWFVDNGATFSIIQENGGSN